MQLNLPNKLTVARVCLTPVFLLTLCLTPLTQALGDTATRILATALFIVISLTDMLDGKIARRRGLVTDFGKFLDPLADKMLVFSACLGILLYCAELRAVFVWVSALIMFRELAVTGLRMMVAGKAQIVIAANWLGKIKTTTQIVMVCTILLEPVLFGFLPFISYRPLSYLTMAAASVMTVISGVSYLKAYWSHLDPSH